MHFNMRVKFLFVFVMQILFESYTDAIKLLSENYLLKNSNTFLVFYVIFNSKK